MVIAVDAVYTWVDGLDPEWQDIRRQTRERLGLSDDTQEPGFADRYVQNGELQFSLMRLKTYAPWIRRVFIVTMNQTPPNLPNNMPITIVDHRTILPESALPCFNSQAIETALHRIPDLAEHFLYFNDDMFLGGPVQVQDFFDPTGRMLLPWQENKVVNYQNCQNNAYQSALFTSALLVAKQHGLEVAANVCRYPSHTVVPKTKSTFARMWSACPAEMHATQHDPFRVYNEVSHYFGNYLDLAKNNAKLIPNKMACYFATDHDMIEFWNTHRGLPKLFCVNQIRTSRFADVMQMSLREPKPAPLKIWRRKF